MRRAGQFYIIDAFIAATILFVGLGLLFLTNVSAPEQRQSQILSKDITSMLYGTIMADLNTAYINAHYDILDETRTPIQQVHYWIWNETEGCGAWCVTKREELLQSLLDALIPPQQNVAVIVDGTVVYNTSTSPGRPLNPYLETPSLLLVNKQVIITPINDTTIIGPVVAEVHIWS